MKRHNTPGRANRVIKEVESLLCLSDVQQIILLFHMRCTKFVRIFTKSSKMLHLEVESMTKSVTNNNAVLVISERHRQLEGLVNRAEDQLQPKDKNFTILQSCTILGSLHLYITDATNLMIACTDFGPSSDVEKITQQRVKDVAEKF